MTLCIQLSGKWGIIFSDFPDFKPCTIRFFVLFFSSHFGLSRSHIDCGYLDVEIHNSFIHSLHGIVLRMCPAAMEMALKSLLMQIFILAINIGRERTAHI